MKITICCSIKFFDEVLQIKQKLEQSGHEVFMPIKVPGVDYWSVDGTSRIEAKKSLGLIGEHMNKIEKSDAILVVNYSKGDIENYIGANTFIEMGFAHYTGKKIFILNTLPDQKYIHDELVSFDATILNGDLENIK